MIQKIAAEARRRSGGARDDFLDDICGTDHVLREKVQRQLEDAAKKGGLNQEDIQRANAGTLVLDDLAMPATRVQEELSKNSIHPPHSISRFLPGKSLLVRIWASRFYRNLSIISFVILILLLSIGSRYLVWSELRKMRVEEFRALVAADVQALTFWIESQKEFASDVSRDREVRDTILKLVREKRALRDSYSAEEVIEELEFFRNRFPQFNRTPEEARRFLKQHDPVRISGPQIEVEHSTDVIDDEAAYAVVDVHGTILASSNPAAVNQHLSGKRRLQMMADFFSGTSGFIPPMHPDQEIAAIGDRPDVTLAWVYTPIYDESSAPAAVLCFGYFSTGNFTRSLVIGRTGITGEAYAFDSNAKMLSESRFTQEMWRRNLLPTNQPTRGNFDLHLPHVSNVQHSFKTPKFPRLIGDALNQRAEGITSGVIMDPYNGYRGEDEVGAWKWLEPYNFGVAYEAEAQETFRPFTYISIAQIVLICLIAGFAGLAYYAATLMVQLRRSIGENVVVGSYQLLRKIGEGGMGQVYLARHQMLKRPTAVKLVRPEQTDPALLKRFEREVQLSSRLKHPNTVEIYDYGKTPDEVFYYAMEYLDGITLEALVRQYGWQPIGRVLSIMRQVSASLREAHASGLIHRDIKPLNIMLCRVGGEFDVAKVLDFGLVKNLTADPNLTSVTNSTEISGTPMYIPPERVKNPTQADPRVDIYALGATVYFMLTGQTIFSATSAVDVLVQIVTGEIPTVNEASDRDIPEALQDLLSRCLAKNPDKRPQSADQVLREVEALMLDFPWTQEDAQNWWQQHIPNDQVMELIDQPRLSSPLPS